MRRRRRFTRSFAGKRGGRNFFWLRFTPFTVDLREASTATHSSIFLLESDYQDASLDTNQTRRGGPRLERLIVDYGLAIQTADNTNWFGPGGDAQYALIPEWMIWKQDGSQGSSSEVLSSLTFDNVRARNRILMNEVPNGEREVFATQPEGTSQNVMRTVQGHFESKVKVRLGEAGLGVAWRGFFDTGSTGLNAYTDWFRPTLLISVP